MRVGEFLYFSPNFKFADLDWDDQENLIRAFQDRVFGFYLTPARELNRKGYGFACGVLCVATVDFIARIATGEQQDGRRFVSWLRSNIKEFDKPNPKNPTLTLATRFYDEFRNGLVHEGLIKNLGQFSYEKGELVLLDGDVMLINPKLLLVEVEKALEGYLKKLHEDPMIFKKFKNTLKNDFEQEVNRAKRI